MAKKKAEAKRKPPLRIEGAQPLRWAGHHYVTYLLLTGERRDRFVTISKPAAMALYCALAEAHGKVAPIAAYRSKR